MIIEDLMKKISLRLVNEGNLKNEISTVYIGDLLSFVMANGEENALWLTVQRHINVIAVAQLNEFSGIIFVQDVEPDEDVIKQAQKLDLPLFISSLDAYSLSKELMKAGI